MRKTEQIATDRATTLETPCLNGTSRFCNVIIGQFYFDNVRECLQKLSNHRHGLSVTGESEARPGSGGKIWRMSVGRYYQPGEEMAAGRFFFCFRTGMKLKARAECGSDLVPPDSEDIGADRMRRVRVTTSPVE